MRDAAYAAIPSAWPGLSDDNRADVIDLLSTFDYPLAFDYLLTSVTIDSDAADRIRAADPTRTNVA